MAISSSLSTTLFPLRNSTSVSSTPKISTFSFLSSKQLMQPHRLSTTRTFAAPETLDFSGADSSEVLDFSDDDSSEAVGIEIPESHKLAPKQKIRIKLRSYYVPLIEDSCKQILDAAKTTNAKTMGPVPLPTKKRIYCVLKSPHVHKDARFHFEIRTHQRLIDILYPTAKTIDSLMALDIPAGVDVEVKL